MLGIQWVVSVFLIINILSLKTSRPAPKITWKKNDQQIISGQNNYDIPDLFFGRQLTIMNVKKDKHESPQYSCEAKNKMNSENPLKHNIELQVQGKHNNALGKKVLYLGKYFQLEPAVTKVFTYSSII